MVTCTCNSADFRQCRLGDLPAHGRVRIEDVCDQIPGVIKDAYLTVQAGRIAALTELREAGGWAEATQFVENNTCLMAKYLWAQVLLAVKQGNAAENLLQDINDIEGHPAVLHSLACLCAGDARRLGAALTYAERAHELAPTEAWIYCAYARNLMRAGYVDEGFKHMCRAAQMAPDDSYLQATCLWYRHYVPEQDRCSFFQAYQGWGRRFAPMHLCRSDHLNQPEPGRRLRIGYISPDFCRHAVAHTFEPILDGHDRAQVELFGYGNVECPDDTTERLQAKFDHYRDIHGQHLELIVRQIRLDQIDILVALSGHCTGNCLPIMAYKPAPIQADFGGISTTGMEQIDYRITDELYDPPETHAHYVEQSVCLPGGLSCFRPPPYSPLVGPLPAQQCDRFCFGSFNNNAKISSTVLGVWAHILREIPQARMILKFPGGTDVGIQETYYERFAALGVSRQRINILGRLPFGEHMDLLNQVDMLLDTYPYNGGITTLEGLWMGVPTLTWTGETFVSRAGLSILKRVGLEVFSARSAEEYVQKARAFAGQIDELAQIRCGLRSTMLHSPLCDLTRFSRELEHAYRRMWHAWCHDVVGVSA